MYDIIGDIHGHADELKTLLIALGYQDKKGHFEHPSNKAIFLGDFIDKGPQQRETLDIVMPMVQSGAALSVMGNHELNAIAYHTCKTHQSDQYLRPHTDKNRHMHKAFLDAYPDDEERNEVVEWFKALPLWLEIDGIRIIHACWDQDVINRVEAELNGSQLTEQTLHHALTYKTALFDDIECLLKGVEISLPEGEVFIDPYGIERTELRAKWWLSGAIPFNQVLVDEGVAEEVITPIDENALKGYSLDCDPCFIGHYWRTGTPERILPNLACVDYSVAKKGKLVAYRYSGESMLENKNFHHN